jgi:hypothetical protein
LSQKSVDTAGDRVKDSRCGFEVSNLASIVREMGNRSYQRMGAGGAAGSRSAPEPAANFDAVGFLGECRFRRFCPAFANPVTRRCAMEGAAPAFRGAGAG